jgi:hypothetical protein
MAETAATTPFQAIAEKEASSAWFDQSNAIHATVERIANVESQAQAESMIDELEDLSGFHQFAEGGIFVKMSDKGWSGGKGTFYDYCFDRFGIKRRKVQWLMNIYNSLVTLDVPWELAKEVGWSNLKQLSTFLCSLESEDEVLKVLNACKGQSVSWVAAALKDWKSEGTPTGDIPTTESTPVTKMTFQLHDDQRPAIDNALMKAKDEGNTEFDGVALEYICMDYLAGGKKETPSLSSLFKNIRKDADDDNTAINMILKTFCDVFDQVHLEVHVPGDDDL